MDSIRQVFNQADAAHRRGDYDAAADLYLQAFRLDTDPWSRLRYVYFTSYVENLTAKYINMESPCNEGSNVKRLKSGVRPTTEDFKNLKCVADSEEEPTVFRAAAALTLGQLYMFTHNDDLAADFYRETIALSDSEISDEEKHKVFRYNNTERTVESLLA